MGEMAVVILITTVWDNIHAAFSTQTLLIDPPPFSNLSPSFAPTLYNAAGESYLKY